MFRLGLLFVSFIVLAGCAISPAVVNQYQWTQYRAVTVPKNHKPLPSLYISLPEAVPGFQTDQMLYTKMPLVIKPYAHNIWSSPPADMLYPLIIQSLQKTNAFEIVSAGSHAENYEYRLDTQLLYCIQNFQKKPAHMEITIKATLTHSISGDMVASRIFRYSMPCPKDSPDGGAIAANRIAQQFTYELSGFAIQQVKTGLAQKT